MTDVRFPLEKVARDRLEVLRRRRYESEQSGDYYYEGWVEVEHLEEAIHLVESLLKRLESA